MERYANYAVKGKITSFALRDGPDILTKEGAREGTFRRRSVESHGIES
jgi:hypothetical protein